MKERICLGDEENIPCPHCGKYNYQVTKEIIINRKGDPVEWEGHCQYCRKKILFIAKYVLDIKAFPWGSKKPLKVVSS